MLAALSSPRANRPQPDLAALTVLVVDGEADMRLYLTGCLRTLGVGRIAEASDGHDALAFALDLNPDLVIADVRVPGLSGVALARALRANPMTAETPVLLISGEVRAPPEADGFLRKPFNALRLWAEVERLLFPIA